MDADLAKVHKEANEAAIASWTETDKLYVSVCSGLIALATLFGNFASNPGLSVSLVGGAASARSRNGCNSSSISGGNRVKVERAPSSQGWSAKAANITANGGQYSTIRFQRAVMIISKVAKTRKNNE